MSEIANLEYEFDNLESIPLSVICGLYDNDKKFIIR